MSDPVQELADRNLSELRKKLVPHQAIVIMDVSGVEYETEALSGVENGQKFEIVWVSRPLDSGAYEPCPWPADSVRFVSQSWPRTARPGWDEQAELRAAIDRSREPRFLTNAEANDLREAASRQGS